MSTDSGSIAEVGLLGSSDWSFCTGDTGISKFEDKVDVKQIN